MTKLQLTVAKAIPLSVGRPGFQIIYEVRLTNEKYLNFDCDKIEVFKDKARNVVCTLHSNAKDKPINRTKNISFVIGTFDTAESAKDYASTFIYSLKYYLSKSQCSYYITGRIKDLSSLEIRTFCSASPSLLVPFSFDAILPIYNAHTKNAIGLLEKAEKLSNMELQFFVYVVVLESILDNGKTKGLKPQPFLDLLDSVTEYVNKTDSVTADKETLINHLNEFRTVGSRNAVDKCIQKYFPEEKINCDGKLRKYNKIYHVCYDMRNKFVHYGLVDEKIPVYFSALKKVTYDIVFAYANDPSNCLE